MTNDGDDGSTDADVSDRGASTPGGATDGGGSGDDDDFLGVSRRTVVAAGAGIGLGAVLGGGYAVLGSSSPGRSIEPTEPDDDGEASLAELHYILENSGPEDARLDVTEFRYHGDDGDDLIAVTYDSRAASSEDVAEQHLREVEQAMFMYSEYVRQDGNNSEDEQGSVLVATISDPAPSQADGYEIHREWVRRYNSGQWSGSRTLSAILGTERGEDDGNGNESSTE
jgi:hypothetical protein